jgi:hypothetical protein
MATRTRSGLTLQKFVNKVLGDDPKKARTVRAMSKPHVFPLIREQLNDQTYRRLMEGLSDVLRLASPPAHFTFPEPA